MMPNVYRKDAGRYLIPQQMEPAFYSPKQSDFLTRREVTQQLKISLPTLDKWIKDGTIKAYKVGRLIRFKSHDVHQFLSNHQVN